MIGGTGRSGSNVLRDRLCRHPDMAALPFESRFPVDPDGLFATFRALNAGPTPFEQHRIVARFAHLMARVARRGPLDQLARVAIRALRKAGLRQIILRAYADWELETHFPGFEAASRELVNAIAPVAYPGIWPGRPGTRNGTANHIALRAGDPALEAAFRRFLAKILDGFLERHDARVLVDDNTYNLFFAPEIVRLMPDAHLLHIVRDPRDVVASFLRQRWCPDDPDAAIHFYRVSMDHVMTALERVDAERVTELRLEDLAQDPDPPLQALVAKMGLPPAPPLTPADFAGTNQGRWQQDLPQPVRARISDDLAPYLERYGYDA